MKAEIESRKAKGVIDHVALAVTTVGVGYLPLAPGTWGSAVGIGIYLLTVNLYAATEISSLGRSMVTVALAFALLCVVGIWATGRAAELFGNTDPPQAVVDEVMGQLLVFAFVPFTTSWQVIAAGFLLFRLFDVWKPFPINRLQGMPGGIGICADDLLAGLYGGVILAMLFR